MVILGRIRNWTLECVRVPVIEIFVPWSGRPSVVNSPCLTLAGLCWTHGSGFPSGSKYIAL